MKSTGTEKLHVEFKHLQEFCFFVSWLLLKHNMLLFRLQEGETVLISAARDGHLEVVRTLLSKYADVEAADAVSD